MKSRSSFNAASLFIFALQLVAQARCTRFASHVSVNTPARSFTHGVGDPLPLRRYHGQRSFRQPPVRLTQRSQTQRSGYPRVKPSIPFNDEEIRGNGLNALTLPYDIHMGRIWNEAYPESTLLETSIPVLPPSPYRVDSPDPESLWPEGLFLPPVNPSHFGYFGRRTDSEPEIVDPYLLEGSEALAAVRRARDHGIYFFHDIPHIESLLANQELRSANDLKPHRLGSIRHTWPYNRP